MNTWTGRALITAGTAGMVYGVYLMAGKGWAVLLASFCVYVLGYALATRNRASGRVMVAGEDLDAAVFCRVGPDCKVYAANGNPDVKTSQTGVRYVTTGDVLGSASGQALVKRTGNQRRREN